jgi:hypothetical protein
MEASELKYKVWSVNTYNHKPLWVMGEFADRTKAMDYADEICRDGGASNPRYERVLFYSDAAGVEREAILVSDEESQMGAIIEGLVIVVPEPEAEEIPETKIIEFPKDEE